MTSQLVIFRAFLLYQSTGHFQSFFIYFFFRPPTLDLKKIPLNQLIKKIWPHRGKFTVLHVCVHEHVDSDFLIGSSADNDL